MPDESVNTTGYPLEFDAILNDGISPVITSILDNLTKGTSGLQSNFGSLDEILSKVGSNPALKQLVSEYAELQKQQASFQEALSKTSDTAAITNLNQQIADTTAKMKGLAEQVGNLINAPKFDATGLNQYATELEKLKADIGKFSQMGAEGVNGLTDMMDTLISKSDSIRAVLNNTLNPELISKYNEGLKATSDQLNLVGTALDEMHKNGQAPDDDPEQIEKSVAAYTKLKQIKNQIAQIVLDGGQGNAEYERLNKEAQVLSAAIKNTNKEVALSGNVKGITALQEGVRGLVGGFEALSGAISIFSGDSKEAEEATKKVIGAMGILNGVEELASILAKNSALNFYLQGLAHKSAAAGAVEQKVATKGLNVAEQGATIAQKGLNSAMLANPVEIIVAGLIALFAAYETYTHTLGKATDAEKERAASLANSKEVSDKAIEGYGQEVSAINAMLTTAKSELATREEKEKVLDDIKAQYPGYLNSIDLENIGTEKTNELIARQIDLLKAKATAQAAQDVYTEKLKDQLKAQSDLEVIQQRSNDITSGVGGDLLFNKVVKEAQKQIKDATIATNVAFDQQTDALNKLAAANQSDAEKAKILVDNLDKVIQKSSGTVRALLQIAEAGSKIDLQNKSLDFKFDPAEFDKQKENIIDLAQFQVDSDKNSFSAKKDLLKKTFDEELAGINLLNSSDRETKTLALYGKYLSQLTDLSEQQRQKELQAQADAANATVTMLTLKGQEGTDAFYDARIVAIKAAAAKELDAAKSNADDTKHIYAQLALDIKQIELDRVNSQLQAQRDGVAAELLLVKEGSREELALRLRDIVAASEQELNQVTLTENKKNEIKWKAAKDSADLIRQYSISQQQDIDNIQISNLNSQLARVQSEGVAGTRQELDLQLQLVQKRANLDVLSAQESIKNEQVRLAKIAEINAQALKDRKKLLDDFNTQELQNELTAIQKAADIKNQNLDLIIQDSLSSSDDVLAAKKQQIANDIDATEKQINTLDVEIVHTGDKTGQIKKQIDSLRTNLDGLNIQAKNSQNDIDNAKLGKISKDLSNVADSFSTLANNARDLNDGLFQVVGTLSSIVGGAKVAFDSLNQFTAASKKNSNGKTDVVSQITAGLGFIGAGISIISTIGNLVEGVFNAGAKQRAALEEEEKNALVATEQGEVAINDEYRKRLLLQAQINQSKLDGLRAEADALKANSASIQADYNKILADIQAQGRIAITQQLLTQYAFNFQKLKEVTSLTGLTYDQLFALNAEGKLDDRAKALFQTLQDLKSQMDDINTQTEQNVDEINQQLTGTTAQSIADSITEGFEQGKKSISDFADDFQDLMRKSILNAFEYQAIEKPIQDFYQKFVEDSKKGLSQTSIQQLQAEYNSIIASAGKQFDQLSQLTKVNLSDQSDTGNSLSGAIKGITEQQADLLAGQFSGLRITAIEQLQIAKNSFAVLNKIENNTSRISALEGYLRTIVTVGIKIQ